MLNQRQSSSQTVNRDRYWQQKLQGTAPLLNFPTDRPRVRDLQLKSGAKPTSDYCSESFTVSPNTWRDLTVIARTEQVSLAVLLLSAWQVFLYRYTEREDLVVGWANYRSPNGATNILPVRTLVQGEQKFKELLIANQQQIAKSTNYLKKDLIQIVEEIELANPVLQILFQFNSLSNLGEVIEKKRPQSELKLNITESDLDLSGKIEYDSSLFNSATVCALVANYQVLLGSIVSKIDTVNSLTLISEREKEQVLFKWNQTESPSSKQAVHQLFAAQVQQNGDGVAVVCREQQLTYSELNQKSNQLARYLQKKGVGKGTLVGLCIERSLSMVIAVMAILKAGAAYVPLDITNPPARIAFILEDAKVEILVTQASLLPKLPKVKQTICSDRKQEEIEQEATADLDLSCNLEDLAHVVYTSGSTGKPKGVMLTHGNLSHYACSLQQAFEITPADVYLHRGSIALIVSARQLLMPLAQGATVVVLTPEETKDPLEFFALIKRRGVTIVDHVPSFWRNLWGILEQQTQDFRDRLLDNQVRLVAAGGEQVTPEIYQCWRQIFRAEVKLANIYGQTEGTGVVTVYPIPDVELGFKSLPVGSPIPNMKVYLLDKNLQPVPIGVTAEIHISGAGVASGYLNRPELTQDKFIANPYVLRERLYKTGDLGRYLANGSIQFLGRSDRQVNINGLRIELGEIEAVLSQHPLVQEAAVVVGENKLGETILAYIVPSPKARPTAAILRSYLLEQLPAYMIPRTFDLVSEFPLTTSGKVDRRALSALEREPTVVAPRDRLEAEVVAMLQTILGIKTVSVEADFVELGGNSLLAARLVTELEHKYGHKISLAKIFQASTPAALAMLIDHDVTSDYPPSFVPIKQGNSQPIVFCIHNLGYGLEFYRPLAKYLGDSVTLYGLSSSFDDASDKPHFRDIRNSAAYYAKHIQRLQPQGAYHLLAVSFGGVIAYEIAQILLAQGHEVKFLGLLDSYCPKQNAVYESPPVKERLSGHLQRIRTKGLSHIARRIQWRINYSRDNILYGLYQVDWIRDRLIDPTSRSYAQMEYLQQRKEHQQVNQGYEIQPYPGKITLFRAADDANPKRGWQELALGRISTYDIPGEHIGMLQEPMVQTLAAKILPEILPELASE